MSKQEPKSEIEGEYFCLILSCVVVHIWLNGIIIRTVLQIQPMLFMFLQEFRTNSLRVFASFEVMYFSLKSDKKTSRSWIGAVNIIRELLITSVFTHVGENLCIFYLNFYPPALSTWYLYVLNSVGLFFSLLLQKCLSVILFFFVFLKVQVINWNAEESCGYKIRWWSID